MFDLTGEGALVTGAGSGIGAAIAALFARQGALRVPAPGPNGRPEEVAELALYLCSDEASFITDQAYPIGGGVLGTEADPLPATRARNSRRLPGTPGPVGLRQGEPNEHLLLRPDFGRGITLLEGFGLAYDILIYRRNLPVAIELVERFPRQRFRAPRPREASWPRRRRRVIGSLPPLRDSPPGAGLGRNRVPLTLSHPPPPGPDGLASAVLIRYPRTSEFSLWRLRSRARSRPTREGADGRLAAPAVPE